MDDLELNFGGQAVTVSLDLLGNVTTLPASVTGLTLSWQSETATTGRLKAEYNGELYSLTFDNPTNALGFKTADRDISVSGDEILVRSTDKAAFSISASAESLADTRLQLGDLPHEDSVSYTHLRAHET